MEKINSTIIDFFVLLVITVVAAMASRNLNVFMTNKSTQPYTISTSSLNSKVFHSLIQSKVAPVPLNSFLMVVGKTKSEKSTPQELSNTNQGVIDYNSTRSNKE
jgi:hypothetical protein